MPRSWTETPRPDAPLPGMGRGGGQEPAMQLPTKYRRPAGAGGTRGSPGLGGGWVWGWTCTHLHPQTSHPGLAPTTDGRSSAATALPTRQSRCTGWGAAPRHRRVPPLHYHPPPACHSALQPPLLIFTVPPPPPGPAPSCSVQCLGCSFVWTVRYGIKVVLGCSAFTTPPPPPQHWPCADPHLPPGSCPIPTVLLPHPGEGSSCELRGGGESQHRVLGTCHPGVWVPVPPAAVA